MGKYIVLFVSAAVATFALLFRAAKDLNAFVPSDALLGSVLSSFAVYLLIFGFLLYYVLVKLKWASIRVGAIVLFFVAFLLLLLDQQLAYD